MRKRRHERHPRGADEPPLSQRATGKA
jgi:hypothetical protein